MIILGIEQESNKAAARRKAISVPFVLLSVHFSKSNV